MACISAAAWLQTCKERFGPARLALVGALTATAGWALTGALTGAESHPTGFAEVLRDLCWIFVIYRLFAADGRLDVIRPVRPLLAALCFVELAQAGLLVFLATYPQQQLAFSLGFGPKVVKVTRGDTEYCISIIPLGGYVKLAGEEAPSGDPTEFQSQSK